MFGLFCYALGLCLCIQANIGLAPWEAFHIGLTNVIPFSFGLATIVTGLVIIVVTFILGEKIGFGTILNILFIGIFADIINATNIIPLMSNFWLGLIMLIIGMFTIALASFFYIGSGLGCGPRDSLMVALVKRFPNTPVGVIRSIIEGSVLIIGWLLGGKVGVGTVISVFGLGIAIEYTFKSLKFQVENVKHENVRETINSLKRAV